jgi:hypothetical protein
MTRPRWQSRPATEADLPAVLALLAECDLPADGLAEHLSTLLVAEADQRLIGTAGLELYGQRERHVGDALPAFAAAAAATVGRLSRRRIACAIE